MAGFGRETLKFRDFGDAVASRSEFSAASLPVLSHHVSPQKFRLRYGLFSALMKR
jgi:hypothetical protein